MFPCDQPLPIMQASTPTGPGGHAIDAVMEERLRRRAARQDATHNPLVRERQWLYIGPILAAPLAHIAVSMYRKAHTPLQKRLVLGVGVFGSTVLAVGMRLALMNHAGYAGAPNSQSSAGSRVRVVTEAEKHDIQNPSMFAIMKDALKGFG